MTAVPKTSKRYTPQEYYALERAAEYKSEYFDGEIFAMARGTIQHSLITANVTGQVRSALKNGPCIVFESNLRVRIIATGLRTYPDATVVCGPIDYDPEDPGNETITNPTVIFEVLSPSTEAVDRGRKARQYRKIASLKAYVLVSQFSPEGEIHHRNADGQWSIIECSGLDASARIPGIDIDLPLAEIYYRATFSESRERAAG